MKRIILTIIFLTIALTFKASNVYRHKLDSAWKIEKSCNQLIKELEKNISTTSMGYLGVAYIMKSNHVSLPWVKIANFNKGKNLLEKAIAQNPTNIEMIFYRYEIQTRVPKILNYDSIAQDRKDLKAYINNKENMSIDIELYKKIKERIG
jgi:hypothetical protein